MPLYRVQDDDRPMWVIAPSWGDAIEAWKTQIRVENDGQCSEPSGVELVCYDNDVVGRSDLLDAQQQLAAVDAALAHRPALWGEPNRAAKIEKACCEAGRVAGLEHQVAELRTRMENAWMERADMEKARDKAVADFDVMVKRCDTLAAERDERSLALGVLGDSGDGMNAALNPVNAIGPEEVFRLGAHWNKLRRATAHLSAAHSTGARE